jgi:hypothetical protein
VIGVVLDAGALIALERNDRSIWAAPKLAIAQGSDVIVPSTALAQVWRGTGAQARLAKALQFCVVASFDPVARSVGERTAGHHGLATACPSALRAALKAATSAAPRFLM